MGNDLQAIIQTGIRFDIDMVVFTIHQPGEFPGIVFIPPSSVYLQLHTEISVAVPVEYRDWFIAVGV
jgi:hypothetical protein